MYNNNGTQPSQGGHLAGYDEILRANETRALARRQNIEGYNEGLDIGQAAGYRNGYNVGHTAGWNEAVAIDTVAMDEQKDITRQVAAQRDVLQAEVSRQRQLIAQLEARLDADRAAATKTIAQWKTYSEGLKTQRDQVQQKFDALQGVVTQLRATTSRIEDQLSAMTEARDKAVSDHAQQLWLHQRGLVFMNTMYGVLSALNDDTCPYVEEVRDLFAATWQEEVEQAVELDRMQESPVNDPSFVLAYPQMSSLISEMVMRAGHQLNPVDESELS